jgi:ribulose-5-phosphate 4-epimerase/fuculose-1-phosphate aldolase
VAHDLKITAPRRPSGSNLAVLDSEATRAARVDLAACFRMAANLGLAEGVCNHFSAMVPGSDELFLVNPHGRAFAEVTASSLLVCDFHGNVVAGEGKPEATAFHIHARLHERLPRARVALHTHMPQATALCMVEGEPLVFAGQTALKFWGRVAVDPAYGGLALDEGEGDRIAAALGDADVIFMRHHGVMVLAPTIAKAWDDLYYLERAAEVQVIAESTGRRLIPVPPDVAAHTAAQLAIEDVDAHLASVKRRLAVSDPDFAD